MNKILILILSSFLTMSASATEFLNREEVKLLLTGKKVLARAPSGALVDIQLNQDFTISTSFGGGDTGKWRLIDDGYCTTWKKIRQGAETCFKITKKGITYFVIYPDGAIFPIARIDEISP